MSPARFCTLLLCGALLASAEDAAAIVASADTYVDSKMDAVNFGSDPTAFVGRGFFVIVPFVDRALLEFPLPTFAPGTHVAGARLRVFIDSTTTDPFSLPIVASLLDSPFVENTVTWDTQPGVLAAPIAPATMTTLAGDWFEMDVTALVNATLQSGDPSTLLVRLAALDESINDDTEFAFRTKEFDVGEFAPQLILSISAASAPTLTPAALVGLVLILLSLGRLTIRRAARHAA